MDNCLVCNRENGIDWVQCDKCDGWVHTDCIDPPRDDLENAGFECKKCTLKSPRASRPKRRRTEVNYARLNQGIVEIGQTHPHVSFFSKWAETQPGASPSDKIANFFKYPGQAPLKISSEWFSSLEMDIGDASKLSPQGLVGVLGEDYPVPVMDSVTQQGVRGWTLGRWRAYHDMTRAARQDLTQHGTLNVISLEISGTDMDKYVSRPRRVRDIDLVDKVWPNPRPKPKVRMYSLTGAANSFTDFHIDFAGTSVFYHILEGRKSFIFIEPSLQNLRAYEKWCLRSDQGDVWFPLTLKSPSDAFQIDIGPGDSLLIPSGWIHAVYTPEDAVVVGGNFLTLKDMPMQKVIAGLEERTNVPNKFRFPMFADVLKYTEDYLQKCSESSRPQQALEHSRASYQGPEPGPSSPTAGVMTKQAASDLMTPDACEGVPSASHSPENATGAGPIKKETRT